MKKITKPNYSLATPADLRALLSVGHCKAVYYEHLAKESFQIAIFTPYIWR